MKLLLFFILIIMLLLAGIPYTVSATAPTFKHSGFVIGDGKGINLSGTEIFNGVFNGSFTFNNYVLNGSIEFEGYNLSNATMINTIIYANSSKSLQTDLNRCNGVSACTIVFQEGIYSGLSNLILKNNTHLLGLNPKTTILKAANGAGGIIYQSNFSDVTIEGLTFDSNNESTVSYIQVYNGKNNNITIKNNFFTGGNGIWGIKIGEIGDDNTIDVANRSLNIRIEDNVFTGGAFATYEAVLIVNTLSSYVKGNIFQDMLAGAASVAIYGYSQNSFVENNIFQRNVLTQNFYTQESKNIKITNNIFDNVNYNSHQITLINSENIFIRDNIINSTYQGDYRLIASYDNGGSFDGHKSWIGNTKNVYISENYLSGGYYAIVIPIFVESDKSKNQSGIYIDNNFIYGQQYSPIRIGQSSDNISDIVIRNNQIWNSSVSDYGVISVASTVNTIKNVTIIGNTNKIVTGGGSASAIWLDNVSNVKVIDNDLSRKGVGYNILHYITYDTTVSKNNYGSPGYDFGILPAAPTTFGAGDKYFNSSHNNQCTYNGTVWIYYNSTSGC